MEIKSMQCSCTYPNFNSQRPHQAMAHSHHPVIQTSGLHRHLNTFMQATLMDSVDCIYIHMHIDTMRLREQTMV